MDITEIFLIGQLVSNSLFNIVLDGMRFVLIRVPLSEAVKSWETFLQPEPVLEGFKTAVRYELLFSPRWLENMSWQEAFRYGKSQKNGSLSDIQQIDFAPLLLFYWPFLKLDIASHLRMTKANLEAMNQPYPRAGAGCAPSVKLANLQIRKIAVLDFADSVERRTDYFTPPFPHEKLKRELHRYLPNDGRLASAAVENALSAGGRFTVVERRDLEKVLQEQRLELTGLVDAKQAVEIGKMAGVDAVLMGSSVEERIGNILQAVAHDAVASFIERKGTGQSWETFVSHDDSRRV